MIKQQYPMLVDGLEFYDSKEFRALCKRFGIPHTGLTMDMEIVIPHRGYAKVTHQFHIRRLETENVKPQPPENLDTPEGLIPTQEDRD